MAIARIPSYITARLVDIHSPTWLPFARRVLSTMSISAILLPAYVTAPPLTRAIDSTDPNNINGIGNGIRALAPF